MSSKVKLPSEFDGTDAQFFPLKRLNPFSSRWVVKVRVTKKWPIKHWNNAKGSGYLMSMDFIDQEGTQIRATAFKETADKLNEKMHKNRWYYVAKAGLKHANKNFTSIRNDYELALGEETVVIACQESDQQTAGQPVFSDILYDFISIAEILAFEDDEDGGDENQGQGLVDVIGAIDSVQPLGTVTLKRSGQQCAKQSLLLCDCDANRSAIELTLWGEQCRHLEGVQAGSLLAIKSARPGKFRGVRTLGSTQTSEIEIDADRKEFHDFREKLQTTQRDGVQEQPSAINNAPERRERVFNGESKSISGMKRKLESEFDPVYTKMRPYFYETGAVVREIARSNCEPIYQACPTPRCNRRLKSDGFSPSGWSCARCTLDASAAPVPRFVLQVKLAEDARCSDQQQERMQWATLFDECAAQLLGISAEQAHADLHLFNERCGEVIGKHIKTQMKAVMNSYGGETRVRHTVLALELVADENIVA